MNSQDTETVMSGDNHGTEIILVRMEGKIDRLGDRMTRYEDDIGAVRQRLHDLNNDITPIVMLDLPGRIRTADNHRAAFDARLAVLESVEQQRKGAAALVKVLWAIVGAVGVGGAAAIVSVFQGG